MELPDSEAHPMDVHVGRRLQLRRKALNMSQKMLAGRIGVTFQQIQKYERAANRVSAGKLHDIARTLAVPIYYFFQGYPGLTGLREGDVAFEMPGTGAAELPDQQSRELLQCFQAIENPAVRKQILDLVRTLHETSGHLTSGNQP